MTLVALVAAALLAACLVAVAGTANPTGTPFPGANPAEAQETSGQTLYKVQELGTLGGNISWAYGINNADKVVGGSTTYGDDELMAFLYSDGQMIDLRSLGGWYCLARGINDADEVVGYSEMGDDETGHAFLYSGGVMRDLGTLGGSASVAYGINDAGKVVGSSDITGDVTRHAFLYRDGVMRDLNGLIPANSGWELTSAQDINDNGNIVGYGTKDGWPHAFLYSDGVMRDLGTLGGSQSEAHGINDAGKVVGSSYTSDDAATHAFLYSGGQMRDLGTLGGSQSEALDINNADQVVGQSSTTDGMEHPFLYSDGVMRDLNSLISADSDWELTFVGDINDNGNIVGYGTKDGWPHAFLLTPLPDTTPPTVTTTIPTGITPVAPTINVKATFSEEMREASVKNAFKLFKKGSTNQIAAAFSYDEATDTATLDPTINLRRGVSYKAVVTTVAKDLAGNQLDQNPSLDGPQQMKWFFTIKR